MLARNVCVAWLLLSWSICTAGVTDPSPFDQWLEHRNQRVNDPELVAYYDFQGGSGKVLENQAKWNPELNGVIHGATWVEGRWPGKKALEFHISVSVPGAICLHAFRIRVTANGQPQEWHDQNVLAGQKPVTVEIPIAFNDPPGEYAVTAVDLFTNQASRAKLRAK